MTPHDLAAINRRVQSTGSGWLLITTSDYDALCDDVEHSWRELRRSARELALEQRRHGMLRRLTATLMERRPRWGEWTP